MSVQRDASGDQIHAPVMREIIVGRVAQAVTRVENSHPIVIDATLGLGGHTEALLEALPGITVVGIDRDTDALALASKRLERFGPRLVTLHSCFDDAELIRSTVDSIQAGERGVAAVLMDFGVSSMQLDDADRGFAYSQDAPLDMRMNQLSGPTAADVLNTYSFGDLARVLKMYGDEKFSKPIARAVVARREVAPFTSTGELVELLYDVIPAPARRTGGHPAKRTFQALRVEVNSELDNVRAAVPDMARLLACGGIAIYMSYQSLEDKITKSALTELTASKTPAGLPVELPEFAPDFSLPRRGAEKASLAEQETNPRSSSVRVRYIQRTQGEPS